MHLTYSKLHSYYYYYLCIYICFIVFVIRKILYNLIKNYVYPFYTTNYSIIKITTWKAFVFIILPICCVCCSFNDAASMNSNGKKQDETGSHSSGQLMHRALSNDVGVQVGSGNIQGNALVNVGTQTIVEDETEDQRIYLSSESKDICYGMMLGSMFCTAAGCGGGLLGSVIVHGLDVTSMALGVAVGGNTGCLCGFVTGPVWLPKCRDCIQKARDAECRRNTRTGGYELIEQSTSTQEQSGQNSQSSSPITSQPKGNKRPPSIYEVTETVTSLLLPTYENKTQMKTLQDLQCVLSGASEQVFNVLKLLALTTQDPLQIKTDSFTSTIQPVARKNRFQTMLPLAKKKTTGEACRLFASIKSYHRNLEYKVQSAQHGVVYDFVPGITVGLAYNHYNEGTKKICSIQEGTANTSVKAKTKVDAFSGIVAFNTNKAGPTAHLASFFGWGEVKNVRSLNNSKGQLICKGTPKAYLTGGLAYLGYNLFFSEQVCITPYIEYMVSIVEWSPYKEKAGILSCNISSNIEEVWERSIGIRHCYKLTNISSLQVWLAEVFGKQKINGLASNTVIAPLLHYEVSVPEYKKQYRRAEIGLLYNTKLLENFSIGLHGKTTFGKEKKFAYSSVYLQLNYMY